MTLLANNFEVQTIAGRKDGRGSLTGELVRLMRCGERLIERLDDRTFAGSDGPGRSGVGAHFRHILDFIGCFLTGLAAGRIDYSRRERDRRDEIDRRHAVARIWPMIHEIENIPAELLEKKVLVRSETLEELWCGSSVARELEFLHSHTIHHHALVAEHLLACGVHLSEDFGSAPSTLKFGQGRDARADAA